MCGFHDRGQLPIWLLDTDAIRCGDLSHNSYRVQAHTSGGGVYVDEDEQQEVEYDADDS